MKKFFKMTEESITTRLHRLNDLIIGKPTTSSIFHSALSRECLLDALFILYNECSKDNVKKRHKNISEFVAKYGSVMNEVKALRINTGDFNESALIGEGYFGSVYLVSEKTTGNLYAMKKIKKSINSLQVREEREIMSRRCSKWITKLQYSFQDSDFLYLIMEYMPGGDLMSLMIKTGRFEEDSVKFYLAEIIVALNELHLIGFVHRDVKPENILIDRFGHIKLADFGNATAVSKNGSVISLSPVGTPFYIAPELLRAITLTSKSVHDVTCDFWSVGVIGYEMFYETTPFYDENIHETYSKILKYCEESTENEKITFPFNVKITDDFKSLIENLINKPSKRLTFSKIKNHQFFKNTNWNSLHEQIPPYIPFLKGEDDVSNFDCARKIQRKQSKHITQNIYSKDFCGKDLPFLGYGFIHEEKFATVNINEVSNELQIVQLNNKIKELELIKNNQVEEITHLYNKLLIAEKRGAQSDLTEKILHEAKDEIIRMKEMLKAKTFELAKSKTEIKTLQNSLKIEEEHRLKNDNSVSEVLNSTFKKWEKAKTISDQNYEKQISEKKTEITKLNQKLTCYQNDLTSKIEEVKELHDEINTYKKRLQNEKDKFFVDKREFDKIKLKMEEIYDAKLNELKTKWENEKDSNNVLKNELYEVKCKGDEYLKLYENNLQANLIVEKKLSEIQEKLKEEIDLNNALSTENIKIKQEKTEMDKAYESLFEEHEKLKQENRLREVSKYLNIESGNSSKYQSVSGSLTELHQVETQQLRNDLAIAKEEENMQRCKAEQLEKIVEKLECILSEINERPKLSNSLLEKQNEKLEDRLALIREQVIIERQSAKTANLSLWKIEKQLEESNGEKKILRRRLELCETKAERAQYQKREIEMHVKELENVINQKEARIEELKKKVDNMDSILQEEHQSFINAEKECKKLKHEILEQNQKTKGVNEKIKNLEQKILQLYSKNDSFIVENRDLRQELNKERDRGASFSEQASKLEIKLKFFEESYKSLKIACSITDQQLTDVEELLNGEIEKNKTNQEKIQNLLQNSQEKAKLISQLKNDLDIETSKKLEGEKSIKSLQLQCGELKTNIENLKKQLISQNKELINITNNLHSTQENLEITALESNNIRTINKNFEMEIKTFKEENSKILTNFFLMKESNNKLTQELKLADLTICRFKEENQQLHNLLQEQKKLSAHKDIKFEATLKQYKKLIDYLQLKLENFSQKKKKCLTDRFFGTTAVIDKKGNLSSNNVESSTSFNSLHEEFNREKQKNITFQKQIRTHKNNSEPFDFEKCNKKTLVQDIASFCNFENLNENADKIRNSTASDSTESFQINHKFKLDLNENENCANCIACSSPILCGMPYWICSECKFTVHKKCRSTAITYCNSDKNESIDLINEKTITFQNFEKAAENANDSFLQQENCYNGDTIISGENSNSLLEINCTYDLTPDHILLGAENGLFVYYTSSNFLLKILGIDNVQSFSVSHILGLILFAANNGNEFEPEIKTIDVASCIENRDKFHLTAISDIHNNEYAVIAGSYQVIMMKFDFNSQSYKVWECFKISTKATAILFMHNSVIISANRFLKIDLKTCDMEEFINFTSYNSNHLQNYQSMNIFKINSDEYLTCFTECGIFVDKCGRRSRSCEITWEHIPTNFLYQAPFLYISHIQFIQIIHLHQSYHKTENCEEENISLNIKRVYLNLYMPILLGPSGHASCYSSARDRKNEKLELVLLNGFKGMQYFSSAVRECQ
ncbi:citron rho-interacting kinase isoform X2 [Condylostylus longicornis]|uniref:citron rho-interacting kinase isoform X2 n=1 Tax=Condylostylus longicornis TaxID=2530218 RepID=UPI00244E558C|nr:citron rho-interacting kinase isoform X2 [Condylostylus longicornis]